MADEQFESIDAIEKHYGKLRKAAADEPEKVRDLQIEEREAKADFRDAASAKRELDSHRTAAIAKAGIPEDFHEFVMGGTPEEIDASAAKIKERVEKLTVGKTNDDDAAARLYGRPVNGGGTPPGPKSSEDEAWIADFQKRFDDPSASFSVQEVTKYAEKLGVFRHLLHAEGCRRVVEALLEVGDPRLVLTRLWPWRGAASVDWPSVQPSRGVIVVGLAHGQLLDALLDLGCGGIYLLRRAPHDDLVEVLGDARLGDCCRAVRDEFALG